MILVQDSIQRIHFKDDQIHVPEFIQGFFFIGALYFPLHQFSISCFGFVGKNGHHYPPSLFNDFFFYSNRCDRLIVSSSTSRLMLISIVCIP